MSTYTSSPRTVSSCDPQRLGLVAEAVDEVLERVHAVGQRRELGPHQPLAQQLQLVQVAAASSSVPLEDLDQPRSPARQAAIWARRSPITSTGWRVFFSMIRTPLVLAAGLVELEQRQAQPFLVDLGRVYRDRARRDPADVE